MHLGPKRRVWHCLGLFPTCSSIPVFMGPRWSLFGLWGPKQVVWMCWVSKCIDGVLRHMAGSRNMWLRVGGSTIEKKHKK
jgi:hypothetical protein